MVPYLLLLVPMPPMAGFLLLALDPARVARRWVILTAVVAGTAPALILIPLSVVLLSGDGATSTIVPIFTLVVGEADVALAMGLDPLGAVAGITVAIVGACVMTYAVDYMADVETPDLRRFFALMNLFMAGMLAVVLAADSVLLFLGWELMGLCSFFLIAFYVTTPRAIAAGRKAFIITRIADAALLAGLLLLFLEAGTIRLETLIPTGAAADGFFRTLIALLLLVGALGKSAQFPFHTWLPTAMAGPTPVSALLHSATMVAAGAFLLARFAPIFAETPAVAALTAVAGLVTAAFGAAVAVVQTDVKRLLAYSSISQIGLMVLAVGVGAPDVAMAHFVVHAAFKSLLFLSAGVMAHAAAGDTSIDALVGSRRRTPLAFWAFTAGAASLAGLPIITAGWWSKEAVLMAVFSAGPFGILLWAVAILAAVLTAAYAFRPVFAAARSSEMPDPGYVPHWDRGDEEMHTGLATTLPLVVLAAASLFGGFLVKPIIVFLGGHPQHPLVVVELVGAIAALCGVAFAAALVFSARLNARILHARHARAGFRMDARYRILFVRPFGRLVRRLSRVGNGIRDPLGSLPDPVDTFVMATAGRLQRFFTGHVVPDRIDVGWMSTAFGVGRASATVRRLQTGRVRDYALALGAGAVFLLLVASMTQWP